MLYKETVDPATLELLIKLQEKKYLGGFYLAGSTELSLYFEDIVITDWPVLIKDPLKQWPDIKNKIEKEVLQFIRKNL